MRTQFNVRIAKNLVKRILIDRKIAPSTRDIIAEVALENWFTKYTPEERAAFYKSHQRKPYVPV